MATDCERDDWAATEGAVTSGPIAYSVDRTIHRVTVLVSSQPNLDDFTAFLNRLLTDPNFHAGDDFLWDRQAAKALPALDYVENATRLVRENRQRIGAGRVAFVVSAHSPAHFGMGRMTQIMSDRGDAFRVFTDMNEAIAWLDEGRATKAEKKL